MKHSAQTKGSHLPEHDSPRTRNPAKDFAGAAGSVIANAGVATLMESALRRREGVRTAGGAILVKTSPHTGRSPRDKFFVRDSETDRSIWWDGIAAIEPAQFADLRDDMEAYVKGRTIHVQDLFACADRANQLDIRVVTQYAWHALFIRHLLRRPNEKELSEFQPEFTVIDLPGFKANPNRHGCRSGTAIAISFSERLVLIAGTQYAGEIKKSVFTVLNYLLPGRGVMPMHCSANHAPGDPSDSAVFFGLSGTGKTTLSASPERTLLGDDEHGWAPGVLFNFEGGCYAKTVRLSEENEPQIYGATQRFGSVLENVACNPETGDVDFDDMSLTENGRCGYPLDAIPNASSESIAGEPRHVIMLACDAFSVLPPISSLTLEQAVYHFLSGFTAKVAGTERGLTEPTPTFSACFAAPFLVRPPSEYAALFRECLRRRGSMCWLINTGWWGGVPGTGNRLPLNVTRSLLSAALSGTLRNAPMRKDPHFGFEIPSEAPGVDTKFLDPRAGWRNGDNYDDAARKLIGRFRENFSKFERFVDASIRSAAPGGS